MSLGTGGARAARAFGLTAIGAITLAAACDRAVPPPQRPPAAAAPLARGPAASAPSEPLLPAGVLFDERGAFGRVVVAEQEGLRLLRVDDELMGAVPHDRLAAEPAGDPLAELVALSGRRGLAVVIGLGTGRTAAELARRGPVLVIERDPLVLRAAREHFAFRGEAETMSAADYFARPASGGRPIDLLVLDTFGADETSDEALLAGALALVRAHSSTGYPRSGPLLALRFWGPPAGERAERIRATLRRTLGMVELFGSGVADEPQTVYVIASPSPENLVASPDGVPIAAWRIPDDALARASRRRPEPEAGAAGAPAATARLARELPRERAIELAGYLVRTDDGTLCLDLPHYEMGAQRYRLLGPRVAELERLLPAKATFPTSGDIGSDGPTDATLRELLGGGGFKRAATRFSPVAVALGGRARLRAFVHPDASAFVPSAGRGHEPDHAALRYGGTLYELEVDRLLGAIALSAWRKSLPSLRAALPLGAIERGELEQAAASAPSVQSKLAAVLGPVAPFAQEARLVTAALGAVADAAHTTGSDLRRAVGCDRALTALGLDPSCAGPLSTALDRSLLSCATRFYERSLGPKPSPSSEPARRLLALYRARSFTLPAFERKAAALEARLPGLEELDAPPGRFGLPPF